MEKNKIGMLSAVCVGYFTLMQAANLHSMSVDSKAEELKPIEIEPVALDEEVSESTRTVVSTASKRALSSPKSAEVLEQLNVKFTGWALKKVNIYAEPFEGGAIVGSYAYRDAIVYKEYSDNWVEVDAGYVMLSDVSPYEPVYRSVYVPTYKDFKSYMDYRTIGAWLQQDLQDIAVTGDYGCRMYDDRFLVAVGTACDVIVGDYVDVVLENGTVIEAIVGDIKDDVHTEDNNLITAANGCATEFIVDIDSMDSRVKSSGTLSTARDDWKSRVVEIRVLGNGLFR